MKTIADHGRAIAKLVTALESESAAYLALCSGDMGTPLNRKKQLAILVATVSAGLPSLNLHMMDSHRRWLAARPQSGLIVK